MFANYLLRTSVTCYMDRSLQELRMQTGLMGDTARSGLGKNEGR